MNITPLKQKLSRFVSRSHSTIQDKSSKQWIICPAEREVVPPAIYLKDDLDKITAVMEDSSIEQEMNRIRGGEVNHASTTAHLISNCELLDGSLYKSSVRLPLTKQSSRLIGADVNDFMTDAVLASSYYGSFYFGHWLTDDLTLYLAAEPLGKPVIPARPAYSHEPEYRELLNIQPYSATRIHFNNLILIDDFGQNSFKRMRYEEIRTRLSKIPAISPGGSVFIRRGTQGANRSLTNSTEIENILLAQGFRIIDPEQSSVYEIIQAIRDARLIVGLEGSHMLHSIYTMSQNGGICILQPPYRFNNVLKGCTEILGITYGFVMGEACEGGFSINPSNLIQVLEKIDRALPTNVLT